VGIDLAKPVRTRLHSDNDDTRVWSGWIFALRTVYRSADWRSGADQYMDGCSRARAFCAVAAEPELRSGGSPHTQNHPSHTIARRRQIHRLDIIVDRKTFADIGAQVVSFLQRKQSIHILSRQYPFVNAELPQL